MNGSTVRASASCPKYLLCFNNSYCVDLQTLMTCDDLVYLPLARLWGHTSHLMGLTSIECHDEPQEQAHILSSRVVKPNTTVFRCTTYTTAYSYQSRQLCKLVVVFICLFMSFNHSFRKQMKLESCFHEVYAVIKQEDMDFKSQEGPINAGLQDTEHLRPPLQHSGGLF